MGRLTTKGPIQEFQKIARDEGVTAFWKGAGPEMTRAAAFTASQLATYDETKLVRPQFSCFISHALMMLYFIVHLLLLLLCSSSWNGLLLKMDFICISCNYIYLFMLNSLIASIFLLFLTLDLSLCIVQAPQLVQWAPSRLHPLIWSRPDWCCSASPKLLEPTKMAFTAFTRLVASSFILISWIWPHFIWWFLCTMPGPPNRRPSGSLQRVSSTLHSTFTQHFELSFLIFEQLNSLVCFELFETVHLHCSQELDLRRRSPSYCASSYVGSWGWRPYKFIRHQHCLISLIAASSSSCG